MYFCYYCFFNNGFKFQNFICNGCYDLTMLRRNISDIAFITVKGVDYCCIFYDTNKSEVIQLVENFALDNCGYT